MARHKHADLIIAWAGGAEIQIKSGFDGQWVCTDIPTWNAARTYRIKPEPKPDYKAKAYGYTSDVLNKVVLTFDGETGQLKKAEVI